MATMQSFIDADQARRGATGNQSSGCFLMDSDFRPYADLDGASAAKFFEANGYEVEAHGDIGTNGIAVTKCGWVLSTNGYLSYAAGGKQRTLDLIEKVAA